MKKYIVFLIFSLFIFFIFFNPPQTMPSEEDIQGISSTEIEENKGLSNDESKAYKIFEEILVLTETSDINEVLPKIEALYHKIIDEYPNTALAQECYWRLSLLYVEKITPPDFEKAENVYKEFLRRYPDSVMRNLIIDTLSKGYYKKQNWDKVLNLNAKAVDEFYKTGKISRPNSIFMYAEAKYKLGDFEDAEKLYKVIIQSFPKSSFATKSKKRINEIKEKDCEYSGRYLHG